MSHHANRGGTCAANRSWIWIPIVVFATASGLTGPALASNGSIHPLAIEIDVNANLHPAAGACPSGFVNGALKNPGATADWVKNCLANTDPPSLVDSVARGIKTSGPDQTGAVAVGHWRGTRIVDGIAGADQNIFLMGGKTNDTSTWNIGPGSVGSSKYDITQAYLANNKTNLFFGMERRGNNGTTAFDFEFNQLPPNPATPLIPKRTVGDVLYSFELQGSGKSGSATPHVFKWNGTKYVEQLPVPADLITSINNDETPAAPWGYVNSNGNWVTGNIPRFQFAEASVPLSDLPGVNACGGVAFVQVRTRASSTDNSDLKDTTRIFRFVFGGPAASMTLTTTGCGQFAYDGTGSTDSGGGTNLTYAWDFLVPAGVTLSGGGVVQNATDPTLYHSSQASGTVNVSMPAGVNSVTIDALLKVTELDNVCSDTTPLDSVDAHRQLPATASKTGADGSALTVTLQGSGPGATKVQWQRYDGVGWINVGSAVNGDTSTLVYSSFESDSTPGPIVFGIGLDTYYGKQWIVSLRLRAERTVPLEGGGNLTCTVDSPAVPVKKVTGVDP